MWGLGRGWRSMGARAARGKSNAAILEDLEKRYGRSGKISVPVCQRAVSHRGPAGRKPDLSGTDERILAEREENFVMADCDEQFFLAGWVVRHWVTHTRLFWDFAAGRSGGRRINCHLHGLDAAKTT